MTYATLDVNLGHHPKTAMAGPLAFAFHVAGILYAKLHVTNGAIPIQGLGSLLAGIGQAKGKILADVLVRVRYWEAIDGGYRIHDWLDWNDSAEVVKERREVARARSKAWRVQHTNGVRKSTPYAIRAGTISESESESESDLGTSIVALTRDDARPMAGNGRTTNAEAIEILAFLNLKAGRHYRPGPQTTGFIAARLKAGATPGECRAVIVRRCREWLTDPAMAKFLRPATLFNATKFAQYQGEIPPEVVDGMP
jgi:uncharacterized phage protein (TIGR02220 family)